VSHYEKNPSDDLLYWAADLEIGQKRPHSLDEIAQEKEVAENDK
jgi:hypothetical protein